MVEKSTKKVSENCAALFDETAKKLQVLRQEDFKSVIVERVIVGVFFTGVKLSSGCTGVAYTPPGIAVAGGWQTFGSSGSFFRGRNACDILSGKQKSPFLNVIRLALLNALSVPFMRDYMAAKSNSLDFAEFAEFFSGRKICMVGAIMPLLHKLDAVNHAGIRVVAESITPDRKALLVSSENYDEALRWCDTAVITGSSIANGSFFNFISKVNPKAAIAVVGADAGFVPMPLFRRGVAIVSTVTVTDGEQALDILSEGGGAYQLLGTCVKKINLLNRERMLELGMQI